MTAPTLVVEELRTWFHTRAGVVKDSKKLPTLKTVASTVTSAAASYASHGGKVPVKLPAHAAPTKKVRWR